MAARWKWWCRRNTRRRLADDGDVGGLESVGSKFGDRTPQAVPHKPAVNAGGREAKSAGYAKH